MSKIEIIKTKHGFYIQATPPAAKELETYYTKQYYQQGLGSYSVEYSETEITWWKIRAQLVVDQIEEILPNQKLSFLDIGCGEGWLMSAMHAKQHLVTGVDFSEVGITRWHPHLLSHFTKQDIYKYLEIIIKKQLRFDVVFLGNVIEHVLDPESFLYDVRRVLKNSGLLVMVAPNDFSETQKFICKQNTDIQPWWICYEHISYFNKQSMTLLLSALGYQIKTIYADYPIEFDLLTDKLNYIVNKNCGKEAHKKRMLSDIFIYNQSPMALKSIYTILGNNGIGRNLNYFCTKE